MRSASPTATVDTPRRGSRRATIAAWNPPVALRLPDGMVLDDDDLYAFCRANDDLRIERTAEGVLIIMTPAGGASSARNMRIAVQLGGWAERDGTGVAFDSSGGFVLPNGALRSPDAAWVKAERLDALSAEQRERFLPLAPDFAIELRSPSDPLPPLRRKMQEMVDQGVRLAWLLDPVQLSVEVYRPGTPVQALANPESVSGDVLPGFVLDLTRVW